MAQHSIVEPFVAKLCPAEPVPAKLAMRWTLDPATGKPAARWIVEAGDRLADVDLQPAA
jgi:hypothetical protein